MKLVVDTSILFAALLKKSAVRELLLNPFFEFYVPEFCIEEVEKHVDEIVDRSGLTVENVYLLECFVGFGSSCSCRANS